MMEQEIRIRPIDKKDNASVARLIRQILEAMNVPKTGTAHGDITLDNMHAAYSGSRSHFFVATANDEIIGCAGIAPLQGYDGNICELQKMYVADAFRGQGLGKQLLEHCFARARQLAFDGCYLETLPEMQAAQQLYQKMGFDYIEGPLGNTGHHACTVRMLIRF